MHQYIIILALILFLSGCDGQKGGSSSKNYFLQEKNNIILHNLHIITKEDIPVKIEPVTLNSLKDGYEYKIALQPLHGTLFVKSTYLLYKPNKDYYGNDKFKFFIKKNQETSNIATVSIDIKAVNDIPLSYDQNITILEDTNTTITLQGNDKESKNLKYLIIKKPKHGIIAGKAPNIIYIPKNGYLGEDSFYYCVSDSQAKSKPAKISIHILAASYQKPKAPSYFFITLQGEERKIALKRKNQNLHYFLLQNVKHGKIIGKLPIFSYKASDAYVGLDCLSYKVSDLIFESQSGSITFLTLPKEKESFSEKGKVDIEELTLFFQSSQGIFATRLIGKNKKDEIQKQHLFIDYYPKLSKNGYGKIYIALTNNSNQTISNVKLFFFLDAAIDENINGFDNEYVQAINLNLHTQLKAKYWQIDEPGYLEGTIIKNIYNGYLDNSNHLKKRVDDVAMAVGYILETFKKKSAILFVLTLKPYGKSGFVQKDTKSKTTLYFDIAAKEVVNLECK